MKPQRYEWSCGSATVVNALRVFGISVDETRVMPVAGTTPPSRCAHCRLVDELLKARTCEARSHWRCACLQCRQVRREWRRECSAGTGEKGLLRALRTFGTGLTASEYGSNDRNAAWQWITGSLHHQRVVLLCLDSWNHWALAHALGGGQVVIFDPYPSKVNKSECHTSHLSKSKLMRRWWNGRRWADGEKRLYAISVGKS